MLSYSVILVSACTTALYLFSIRYRTAASLNCNAKTVSKAVAAASRFESEFDRRVQGDKRSFAVEKMEIAHRDIVHAGLDSLIWYMLRIVVV